MTMGTHQQGRFLWIVLCLCGVSVATTPGGFFKGPGSVDIPVVVNVMGRTQVGDVNGVLAAANRILEQAHIQLVLQKVNTGVEIGDGDGLLSEQEVFATVEGGNQELQGPDGPGGGIKIAVAEDVWTEPPGLTSYHAAPYPTVFLATGLLKPGPDPNAMGRDLARAIATCLGAEPAADSQNLMFPGGDGTTLNSNQIQSMLSQAGQIGWERSRLVAGYDPDLIVGLPKGARYVPTLRAFAADVPGDVLQKDTGGTRPVEGGPDLILFRAFAKPHGPSGTLDLEIFVDRPDPFFDTFFDVFFDIDPQAGAPGVPANPRQTSDGVVGIGLPTLQAPFVGVQSLPDGEFTKLAGIAPVVRHVGRGMVVRVEVPIEELNTLLPASLDDILFEGRRADMSVSVNAYRFDPVTGFTHRYDSIDNVRLQADPAPLPCVYPDIIFPGLADSAARGFDLRTVRAVFTEGWGREEMDKLLDFGCTGPECTGPGQPIAGAEAGTRQSEFVNLYDSSAYHGFFSAENGCPDASFPGIDPFESPASNPAGGDDDDFFATEVEAVLHLTRGLHIIGITGDDGATIKLGGVQITNTFTIADGDNAPANTGNGTGGLTGRDFAYEVRETGSYRLVVRSLARTGGDSLELTELLPGGSRVLLNDVASGGSPVLLPFANIGTIIDPFKVSFGPLTVPTADDPPALTSDAVFSSDRALGGEVDVLVRWNDGVWPQKGVTIAAHWGKLRFSAPQGNSAGVFVTYDGLDGSATEVQATDGLGGADLTSGGLYDRLVVEVLSSRGNPNLSFVAFSSKEDASELTRTVRPTDRVVTFPFADFFRHNGGADFANIHALLAVLETSDEHETDLVLGSIAVTSGAGQPALDAWGYPADYPFGRNGTAGHPDGYDGYPSDHPRNPNPGVAGQGGDGWDNSNGPGGNGGAGGHAAPGHGPGGDGGDGGDSATGPAGNGGRAGDAVDGPGGSGGHGGHSVDGSAGDGGRGGDSTNGPGGTGGSGGTTANGFGGEGGAGGNSVKRDGGLGGNGGRGAIPGAGGEGGDSQSGHGGRGGIGGDSNTTNQGGSGGNGGDSVRGNGGPGGTGGHSLDGPGGTGGRGGDSVDGPGGVGGPGGTSTNGLGGNGGDGGDSTGGPGGPGGIGGIPSGPGGTGGNGANGNDGADGPQGAPN